MKVIIYRVKAHRLINKVIGGIITTDVKDSYLL